MATLVRDVLAAHDRHHRASQLPKNLGDGYLYARNPVFRRVRDRVLELGGTFSTSDFPAYAASPHTALAAIVRRSRIPYVDNHAALAAVRAACPRMTMEELPDFRRNHVFHEGAHVIAYRMLQQHRFRARTTSGRQQLVLAALMGESFATTCETLAAYHVKSELDRVFYRYNAVGYSREPARLRDDLARAFDVIGAAATGRVILLSFLFSNFLFEELAPRQFAAILASAVPERAHPRSADVRFLHGLATSHCLGIDLRFRTFFAQAHFKMLGLHQPVVELVRFDFPKVLDRTPTLRDAVDRLAAVVS
jgi:hypothetical protein